MAEPTLEEIDETIATSATEPAEHSADGQTTKSRPLGELLDARDRIASRKAAQRRRSGWAGVIVSRGRTQGGGAC